jgi:hypothetical protein
MNPEILESLKYPVGRYKRPNEFSLEATRKHIEVIEQFPALLTAEVASLSDAELKWIYRPEGWNIRQLVHHVADSHMNAFVRFKLSLTEETPTIKPYMEAKWATLPDVLTVPINTSLGIISGMHTRWAALLKTLSEQEWKTGYNHPEQKRTVALYDATAMYAWHCDHHLAHVRLAMKNKEVV